MHHDVSIIFGNTSLPSYLLKIYALSSATGPMTNMRNTGLIQTALQELLGIAPDQGIVLFLSVPEGNLATDGSTAQGAISRLEQTDVDSPGLMKSISRGMSRRLKSSSDNSAPISLPSSVITTASSTPTNIRSPIEDDTTGEGERRGQRLKKRESLRSILHRHMGGARSKKEGELKQNVKE